MLELLNDDEAVVLMHGLSEVFTFDVAKIKAQRPQLGDKCVRRWSTHTNTHINKHSTQTHTKHTHKHTQRHTQARSLRHVSVALG